MIDYNELAAVFFSLTAMASLQVGDLLLDVLLADLVQATGDHYRRLQCITELRFKRVDPQYRT